MTELPDSMHGTAGGPAEGASGAPVGERLFAATLSAVGLVSLVEGFGYGIVREDGIIGPGFIPVAMGTLLLVLGVVIIANTFRQRAEERDIRDEFEELARQAAAESDVVTGPMEGEGDTRAAALVFALTGVALVASLWLGILLALGLLAFVIMAWVEKVNIWRALAITVAMVFLTWLVFAHFLSVPLDFGVFGG